MKVTARPTLHELGNKQSFLHGVLDACMFGCSRLDNMPSHGVLDLDLVNIWAVATC